MKQVVYHCLKAAEVIHCFPVFSYLWPFSWKLKTRLAAKGGQVIQHPGKIVALVCG